MALPIHHDSGSGIQGKWWVEGRARLGLAQKPGNRCTAWAYPLSSYSWQSSDTICMSLPSLSSGLVANCVTYMWYNTQNGPQTLAGACTFGYVCPHIYACLPCWICGLTAGRGQGSAPLLPWGPAPSLTSSGQHHYHRRTGGPCSGPAVLLPPTHTHTHTTHTHPS